MYHKVFKLHADLLKALSHPKRLEIVHLLRDQELSVSEIQEMLGLSQSNLSQHLMVLRSVGVVITKRNGKQIYYSLAHKNFIKSSDLIRQVLVEKHKDDADIDEFTRKMGDLVPLTQDPVCGMRLSPKTASYVKKHEGQEFYFCGLGCLKRFNINSKKYANKNK